MTTLNEPQNIAFDSLRGNDGRKQRKLKSMLSVRLIVKTTEYIHCAEVSFNVQNAKRQVQLKGKGIERSLQNIY